MFQCTRARDDAARAALKTTGWQVLSVWECALTGPEALPQESVEKSVAAFFAETEKFFEAAGRDVLKVIGRACAI